MSDPVVLITAAAEVIWGPLPVVDAIPTDVVQRWLQGFIFSASEPSALVQRKGGPCAVLAPVQGLLLSRLLFPQPDAVPEANWRQPRNIESCLALALADALTMAAAGSGGGGGGSGGGCDGGGDAGGGDAGGGNIGDGGNTGGGNGSAAAEDELPKLLGYGGGRVGGWEGGRGGVDIPLFRALPANE